MVDARQFPKLKVPGSNPGGATCLPRKLVSKAEGDESMNVVECRHCGALTKRSHEYCHDCHRPLPRVEMTEEEYRKLIQDSRSATITSSNSFRGCQVAKPDL